MGSNPQQRRRARQAKRAARDRTRTLPRGRDVDDDEDYWLVNGPCPVPEGMAHCHAVEVEHADKAHECVLGQDCEAPGALHMNFYRCFLMVEPDRLAHRCVECDGVTDP